MERKRRDSLILEDIVRLSTFIMMSGSADKSWEILKKNSVVTGTCNTNFTQYRQLRYFDEKVTKIFMCYCVPIHMIS